MDLPRSLRVSRDGEEPRYVVAVDVTDGPRVRFTGPVCMDRAAILPMPPSWPLRVRLYVRSLFGRIDRGMDRLARAVRRVRLNIVRRLDRRSTDHVAQHRADLPGAAPAACRPCALDLLHHSTARSEAVTAVEVRHHPQFNRVPARRR